jgi:hypothetical protein
MTSNFFNISQQPLQAIIYSPEQGFLINKCINKLIHREDFEYIDVMGHDNDCHEMFKNLQQPFFGFIARNKYYSCLFVYEFSNKQWYWTTNSRELVPISETTILEAGQFYRPNELVCAMIMKIRTKPAITYLDEYVAVLTTDYFRDASFCFIRHHDQNKLMFPHDVHTTVRGFQLNCEVRRRICYQDVIETKLKCLEQFFDSHITYSDLLVRAMLFDFQIPTEDKITEQYLTWVKNHYASLGHVAKSINLKRTDIEALIYKLVDERQ